MSQNTDYQKKFNSATDAAEYAAQIPGWMRMNVRREEDGRYSLTFEWEESHAENQA